MTPDEINEAICTACGKKYHKPTEEELASGSYYQYEPDYYRNLNACFEMEEFLTESELYVYDTFLWTRPTMSMVCEYKWHVPPEARAEAFLHAKGLWKD